MNTNRPSGRGWAYTGAILGGLVSVAANVAHSFIAPPGAVAGWSPQPGAVVGAIVWPVFLFVAVEILARYTWPAGGWWTLLRFGGMTPVTLVAAFVSYRHLSGLLTYYGEDTLVSTFGPLAVDGLMVMATGAILATGVRIRHTTTTAPVTAPAVPAKPASTNPEPATPATPVVASVSPASTPTPVPVPAGSIAPGPSSTVSPSPAASLRESATPVATLAPVTVPVAPAPTAAASAKDNVTTADAAPPIGRPVPAALLTRARHLAQAHHATTGSPITAGELAVRLRVNSDTATQVLTVLDLAPDHPNRPITTVNGHRVGATK